MTNSINTKTSLLWTMRSAQKEDAESIVQFNNEIFRSSVGVWARTILLGVHPMVTAGDFLLIEKAQTNQIVSSLAFIAQEWQIEDVRLKVGQVEFVGTTADYRGQGLFRLGMEWFENRAESKDCIIGGVQGIPTPYQKLGYHFAIDLKGGTRLWLDQLPKNKMEFSGRILRPAESADSARLVVLHNRSLEFLAIKTFMTEALWLYQEQQSPESEHAYETHVIESAGNINGYIRFRRRTRSGELVIRELSANSYNNLVTMLSFAGERARVQGLGSLVLQLPAQHVANQIALTFGAQIVPPYAWQVRVFDWKNFFEQLAPVFERRIAVSLMIKSTFEFVIHLTDERYALRLSFKNGRLEVVEQVNVNESWMLSVTRPILTALCFGYKDRTQLEAERLEMLSKIEYRYLVDVLFPKRPSYIYEWY